MLSFFRQWSIGSKICDGLLPENVMGTVEHCENAPSIKNELAIKDETELKESIYGTASLFKLEYYSAFSEII